MQDFYQRCYVIKRTIESDDKVLEYIDKIPELVKQGFKTLANTEEYKALQLAVDKGLLDDFQIDTNKLDELIPGHLNGLSHIYIAKGESLEATIKYHLRKQAEDLVAVPMLNIETKMTELIRNGYLHSDAVAYMITTYKEENYRKRIDRALEYLE